MTLLTQKFWSPRNQREELKKAQTEASSKVEFSLHHPRADPICWLIAPASGHPPATPPRRSIRRCVCVSNLPSAAPPNDGRNSRGGAWDEHLDDEDEHIPPNQTPRPGETTEVGRGGSLHLCPAVAIIVSRDKAEKIRPSPDANHGWSGRFFNALRRVTPIQSRSDKPLF